MSRVVQLSPTAKGLAFTRMAIAAALGKGEPEAMEIHGRRLYGEKSLAARVGAVGGLDQLVHVKAEVAAGGTVSGNWAELLAETDTATAEFFALIRERTLLGRIAGLRKVPLRVRLIGMAAGFTGAWVGEGKAVPLSSATFTQETLAALRVAALTVVTDELLRSADPAAEVMIRNDLAGAVASAINVSFIAPGNTGEAGVQPASITSAAPSVNATGDGLADIRKLIDAFPGDLERAVLIGSPETFATLHDPIFLPGLGVRGGQALGIPAFASTATGDTLALIDPDGIAYGDGDIDLRVATQANIEMLTEPTMDAVEVTGAQTVSLWQTNAVALMAESRVNWQAGRPSVAVLEAVPQS